MAEKLPLVYVDGGLSQLPPGDSIEGVSLGTLTAGSGLVGGGDLNTGSKRLDVGLAPAASGVIFVGDAIGLDGVAQAAATAALASGDAGLALGATALSSGVVAQGEAATALASGNAALEAAVNFVGSSSLEFTAASDIQAGYAVGLDDAGKVQSVGLVPDPASRVFATPGIFESASSTSISTVYDSVNNRIVIAYQDNGNSSYGTAIVGSLSGTSISFGTPVVFESASSSYISASYDSVNSCVVIAYQDQGNSSYGTAIVGSVSGTSISFGSPVVFESSSTIYIGSAFDSTNTRTVIAYPDGNNSNYGTAIVGTVSGSSISFGSPVVFESAYSPYISVGYDSTNSRIIISYEDFANSGAGTAIVGTVSGTSISFGAASVYTSYGFESSVVHDSSNNKIVITYHNASLSRAESKVGTVSGSSISFGSAVITLSGAGAISSVYDSTNNRIVIAIRDGSNSNYGTAVVGSVVGTSISFNTPVIFEAANTSNIDITYHSINDAVVIAYCDQGNSNYGTYTVGTLGSSAGPTISSQNNFIGTAQATVASGTNLNVLLPRAIDYNQTGLTPGSFYYVDPTTSGFTTASGEPSTWAGAYNWGPVAKAVSSSGLLLLNPL